jgi:hypothetical protein
MSGDNIHALRLNDEPIASKKDDVRYVRTLLKPFDNIVEKFQPPPTVDTRTPNMTCQQPLTSKVFLFLTIAMVLLVNFPKVQERIGLNQYVAWVFSTFLLVGVLF